MYKYKLHFYLSKKKKISTNNITKKNNNPNYLLKIKNKFQNKQILIYTKKKYTKILNYYQPLNLL